MAFSGSLEKMKIEAYEQPTFFGEPDKTATVYINPASYSQTFKICYNDRQSQGSPGGSPDFNRIPSTTLKFELVFDGTGVVPTPLPGIEPFSSDGIKDQLESFKNVVFRYDGKIHSPYYLKLTWGTLEFDCRLSSLEINYTLFKPDGTPLRARANVTFIAFSSEEKLAKEAYEQSSDLSHVVTIKAGDTLPLLCYDIYGSSTHYLAVARVNALKDFRHLIPGSQLLFPPLQDSAS
jgi:hypothetical protein